MNTDQLAAQLVIDEGLRLKPYKDSVGLLTIGVGRNIEGVGISKEEALHLLHNDIDRVCDQLDNLLPWWKQMSERRMQALANFVFNVGITTALTFKNTLALLQTKQYDKAADAMLESKWARQVGARAKRITDMIREG
jgi:lysozyme